jgi:hypothetical protein
MSGTIPSTILEALSSSVQSLSLVGNPFMSGKTPSSTEDLSHVTIYFSSVINISDTVCLPFS